MSGETRSATLYSYADTHSSFERATSFFTPIPATQIFKYQLDWVDMGSTLLNCRPQIDAMTVETVMAKIGKVPEREKAHSKKIMPRLGGANIVIVSGGVEYVRTGEPKVRIE